MSATAPSAIPMILRGLILRPLEILIGSVYIILGRSSPASLRGGPATALLMLFVWYGSSYWFDAIHPDATQLIWYTPAFEVIAWTLAIRYLLSRYVDSRRFLATWLGIAGVSALCYLVTGAALLTLPFEPAVIALPGLVLNIRGCGLIMKAAFNDRLSYSFAAGMLVGIALLSASSRMALLEVLT